MKAYTFLLVMALPLALAARPVTGAPANTAPAEAAASDVAAPESPATQDAPPNEAERSTAPEEKLERASDSPRVIYPDDRPAWVEAPPTKDGALEQVSVTSGPHYSLGEARRQLAEAVKTAADDYVDRHLGVNDAARYIHYEVQPVNTYEERPEFSFGPMYQTHALLQFDDAFRRQAEQDWKEAVTLSRLVKIGLGGAAMFLLLAVAAGYLKADNATRGFYTRRLRFGAATVILALAAAVFFAVRWIPWI